MWLALLGAGIGALAGVISKKQKAKQEQAALEQQKKNAWQQYLYGKEYSDERFSIQKDEALNQLDTQQKNLDTQVGLSTDEYNTSLLAQAFGIQDARIQNASQTGMHMAAEGASGTRGNENNAMLRAYAEQGLERNIDVQDRQNKNQLNGLVTGANASAAAIAHEKSTWMPGGYRVKEKDAQDNYNLNLANLGQSNFNWQINQANPTFGTYAAGALGGFSQGMQIGSDIDHVGRTWLGTQEQPWSRLFNKKKDKAQQLQDAFTG